MNMKYPNKIYTCEYDGVNHFGGFSHFVVVIAALNKDVAKEFIKTKIGFDSDPVWLMNAVYPTIYINDGSVPAEVQVKILTLKHIAYKKK